MLGHYSHTTTSCSNPSSLLETSHPSVSGAGPLHLMTPGKITAQGVMAAGHLCTFALFSQGQPVFFRNFNVNVILIHYEESNEWDKGARVTVG